jgi:hypothetical protein
LPCAGWLRKLIQGGIHYQMQDGLRRHALNR